MRIGTPGGSARLARQRITRTRREYNRWVANQTLEDYALRFTAKSARKWSALRVANTALGAVSFLALEAIGGTITLAYGFTDSIAAIAFVSVMIFIISIPVCAHAARAGVDVDLLTRGAGFGYIGSTITSLIYASFTFIFFGIEAVILASMLQAFFGVPEWLGYILCAVAVVPLVTHGITFISRLQLWTQPVWFVLNLVADPGRARNSSGMVARMGGFRRSWPSRLGIRSCGLRRRGLDTIRDDHADGGAGRFHPLPAAAGKHRCAALVDGAAARRPGLDRDRCRQAAGGQPARLCRAPFRAAAPIRRCSRRRCTGSPSAP